MVATRALRLSAERFHLTFRAATQVSIPDRVVTSQFLQEIHQE